MYNVYILGYYASEFNEKVWLLQTKNEWISNHQAVLWRYYLYILLAVMGSSLSKHKTNFSLL